MARAKGTTFLHDRHYIVAHYGEEGWQRVLTTLTPEDRAVIASIIAVGWYDHALQVRLIRAIRAVFESEEPNIVKSTGRHAAEEDLTRIHRAFLRMANPAFVLEKAAEYWSRFFDTGKWHVRRVENGAEATLVGVGIVDETWCTNITAYVGRMFELVGAKEPRVTHARCRARGDEHCEFAVRWK